MELSQVKKLVQEKHTVEDLQTQIPFASNFTLVRNVYFTYSWSPCDNDLNEELKRQ